MTDAINSSRAATPTPAAPKAPPAAPAAATAAAPATAGGAPAVARDNNAVQAKGTDKLAEMTANNPASPGQAPTAQKLGAAMAKLMKDATGNATPEQLQKDQVELSQAQHDADIEAKGGDSSKTPEQQIAAAHMREQLKAAQEILSQNTENPQTPSAAQVGQMADANLAKINQASKENGDVMAAITARLAQMKAAGN